MTEPNDRPAPRGPDGARGPRPGGPPRGGQPRPGGGPGGPPRPAGEPFRIEDLPFNEVIVEDKPEVTDNVARRVAGFLAGGMRGDTRTLTATQLRRFYSEVRRIDLEWSTTGDGQAQGVRELILLKPKLAYAAGQAAARNDPSARGLDALRRVLSIAIDQVAGDRARFSRLVDFFEAIVAYYYAAPGSAPGGR